MSAEDIAIDDRSNPTMLFVRLKASKCDQARQGFTLCVGRTNTQLCPVAAVLAYLAVRRSSPGPLFIFQDGSPLMQTSLVRLLRSTLTLAGLDCANYSGHSFRIGAATTAAAAGLCDSTIQTLGRWASDSFRRYIRLPPSELASYSRMLVDRN